MGMGKKKEPLIYKGSCGGRNRTRTCDPIDVNDVLYQLSHATMSDDCFIIPQAHQFVNPSQELFLGKYETFATCPVHWFNVNIAFCTQWRYN